MLLLEFDCRSPKEFSMGRAPCCDKANVKKGPWSPDEDNTLRSYLQKHGTGGNWMVLPHKAGLKRCGKSCRLRWLNYLRPDIKHGGFTEEEDNIICSLYNSIGSRWSVIAAQLPGRTDNDVKNYWNTKLKKKQLAGKIGLDQKSKNRQTFSDGPTSNIISGQVEAEDNASGNSDYHYFNANGSASSCYMSADVKYQQNHDYLGLVLDQNDQLTLPRIMEYSTSTANNNYNYSMPSSQQVSTTSTLFNSSSSFPLENGYHAAWSGNGGAEVLDFDGPDHHYLFSGPIFQEKSNEVAPSFGNFFFYNIAG